MITVIHYSEIGIKGGNRNYFEKKLMNNIKKMLGDKAESVYKRYGRIICELEKNAKKKDVKEVLERMPGIAYFAFAVKSGLNINEIKNETLELLKSFDFDTFKVVTKRSNKNFKYNSQEINELLGAEVIRKYEKKAKMKSPDLKLYVEVGEKEAFIYTKKIKGISGLPVNSSGKVICLLSGGIDSPVAAYQLMKRGCKVIFVHALNNSLVSKSVRAKIEKIAGHLSNYQGDSKIYIVPFEDIQKEIISKVDSRTRMIIYRRFMTIIANKIAYKEGAKAIITGDSIGQVASQTIENLNAIYEASTLPILTPLIGFNKDEIVRLSRKVGTYEYSIMPYPDCCSYMIAKHPETRAEIKEVKKLEELIKNRRELINDSVKNAEVIKR